MFGALHVSLYGHSKAVHCFRRWRVVLGLANEGYVWTEDRLLERLIFAKKVTFRETFSQKDFFDFQKNPPILSKISYFLDFSLFFDSGL